MGRQLISERGGDLAVGYMRPARMGFFTSRIEASIAFWVAFDGFKISDRGSALAFLTNEERHVQ
jgi:hypothetical protein